MKPALINRFLNKKGSLNWFVKETGSKMKFVANNKANLPALV